MDDRSNIEEIKSRLDIVPIVERQVRLKKAGKNFVGLCPFHSEKTPSFVVNPSIQRYKCFGCGESGDIINFVEKTENLDFIDALEKLAKEAGVVLQKHSADNKFSKIVEVNNYASEIYAKDLMLTSSAKRYILEGRKFNAKVLKDFQIGYAQGGNRLLKFVQSKGRYTKQELLLTGLFSEKESRVQDRFFQRIIFPIQDAQGRIVGFTGRILPDSKYGPKYLHTPETPLFKKSKLLYGLYQAKAHIREQDLCIICEGTTDVISSHQNGQKNIVAPLGTAIAEEQLKLITRFTKNILLLMDNDEAGQNALERYFLLGIPLNLNIYTGTLEPYADLDDLMQKEPAKIKSVISKKQDLFTHLILKNLEGKDINNYKEYKEIIDYVSNLLMGVKDEKSYEFFLNQAEKITTIKKELFTKQSEFTTNIETTDTTHKMLQQDKETFFLSLIIYFEETEVLKKIETKFFLNNDVKKILEKIKEEEKYDEKDLIKKFPENETLNQGIFSSSQHNIDPEKKEKYLLNTYNLIRKENVEKIIKKLRVQENRAIEEKDREKAEKTELEIIRLKKLQAEN